MTELAGRVSATSAATSRFPSFVSGVLADLDAPVRAGARILDFGCGEGRTVSAFIDEGYDAYGCDISVPHPTDRVRLIGCPYRIPFDDETFDVVCSDQVLEHVQDHGSAFREIARVLRPNGVSLHVFPARWTPIEPHVRVPLAAVVRKTVWLRLWATLGVRNDFQRGHGAAEVAAANEEYLRTRTKYLRRHELERLARGAFRHVAFVDALALKHSNGRGRSLYPLARRVPAVAWVYGGLRARALFLRKS